MQTCGKLLDFVVVLMALNGFLFPLTKFFFLRSIYNTKVIKLMKDTNWVRSHCSFL